MKRVLQALVLGYMMLALITKLQGGDGWAHAWLLRRLLVQEAGPQLLPVGVPPNHHKPELEAWKKRQLDALE